MNSFDEKANVPIVWSIGGVDPTALAGISADNRAIAVSGAHGVNIVTSVTAQNSNEFLAQHEVPIDSLKQQWTALLEQCKASSFKSSSHKPISNRPMVIKIGLLVSVEQVLWLGETLHQLKCDCLALGEQLPWVIYDPVLRASADVEPVIDAMIMAIKTSLLPSVDLLTPNLPEAFLLSKNSACKQPHNQDSMAGYSIALANAFNCQVLLKGGHVDDVFNSNDAACNDNKLRWCADYYARSEALTASCYIPEPASKFVIRQPCSANENRRGSGCVLASLIAGFVAHDYTFCDAILLSNGVMNKAYKYAKPLGKFRGGAVSLSLSINHQNLPVIESFNGVEVNHFVDTNLPYENCPAQLGLYPVVDSVEWLERLLQQGVRTIQLRIKDAIADDVEALIMAAIGLGKTFKARVFINDYWALAIKHHAYGVHLGQEDLHSADLNAIKKAGLRLGLSTHGIFEAQWASQFAPSYMAIGHIYATQTKDMPSRPQGLEKLHTQVDIFNTKLPLVAIGGITQSRVTDVVNSNIGSVALVTAITKASNPDEVTKSLLAVVGQGDCYV